MEYTVGELAKLSGLTVRALHHYEKLELLHPSGRTQAGYRQYAERDVLALHRILAYRQMGLALKEIGPLLTPQGPSLETLLERQVASAEAELARQERLLAMLRRVAARARAGGAGLTDHLLTLMSMMRTYERHFTPQEIDRMQAMQTALGEEGLARLKAEVAELLPAMRAAMARGCDVRSAEVALLARRWLALEKLVPVDETLRGKGRAMVAAEPGVQRETGLTPALCDFIERAIDAARAGSA